MTTFGVHVGLQQTSASELRAVWQRIEEMGFGWISIWDHFYGATGRPDDPDCLEAVAMHAALACSTSKVRCGSLVYSIGYRHPAVLAKAITAIDQLSGGRVDFGLGAGWARVEYDTFGFPFPRPGVRLDQMEEGIQIVRGLLHDDVTTFEGEWFQVREARNEPRPVQSKIPIWVGGGGEQRTLRIAAQYADGWNVPFPTPEQYAHKNRVLDSHCDTVGRDRGAVRRSVNLGLAYSEESLRGQFGAVADHVRGGVLMGSDEQILARIAEYVAAGAEQVNIAVRAPFDLDVLERFAGALGLH